MSCSCTNAPCACDASDPCDKPKTLCDRASSNNVWIERGCTPNDVNAPGVCMLDTLTETEVIGIIERNDRARMDLIRVTSNERLQQLARDVPRLPTVEQSDAEQTQINRNHVIPFYHWFRGQPPFSQ
jgi:hypothetical protein